MLSLDESPGKDSPLKRPLWVICGPALQLQTLVLNDYVDSSFPDRLDEGSVVTLVLVGIFNRELTNCVIEA